MDILSWAFTAVAIILLAFVLFWRLYFLRDPEREAPSDEALIVSPADGKVIAVLPYDLAVAPDPQVIPKRPWGRITTLARDVSARGTIVSVFMSPLDVHYNRSPVSGKVLLQRHTRGSFHRAYEFLSTLENEKNEHLIQTEKGRIKVIQVAGALARAFGAFGGTGDRLSKGERIRLITLGSQATLVLPSGIEVLVKKDERVRAGETPVARFL